MRPRVFDVDVTDETTDTLASADEASNGAALTLLVSGHSDGLAHKVILTPSGSVSGSYTITGTDADGKTQTETLATDTTSAVTSVNYYLTVTEILNCAAGAETIDAGFVDEVATQTFPIDRLSPWQANIHVDVTGTVDYTVQELWANVYDYAAPQLSTTPWIAITALSGKTADVASQATIGATAIRLIVNSYSSGAELQMYFNQPADD